MRKNSAIAWLQAHAEAHRARANEYAARCNLYNWGGSTETDRLDCQQADDLMRQHIDYAAALTAAAEYMASNRRPDQLPAVVPPVQWSYAAKVEGEKAAALVKAKEAEVQAAKTTLEAAVAAVVAAEGQSIRELIDAEAAEAAARTSYHLAALALILATEKAAEIDALARKSPTT